MHYYILVPIFYTIHEPYPRCIFFNQHFWKYFFYIIKKNIFRYLLVLNSKTQIMVKYQFYLQLLEDWQGNSALYYRIILEYIEK